MRRYKKSSKTSQKTLEQILKIDLITGNLEVKNKVENNIVLD